jgi:hypothetical protein
MLARRRLFNPRIAGFLSSRVVGDADFGCVRAGITGVVRKSRSSLGFAAPSASSMIFACSNGRLIGPRAGHLHRSGGKHIVNKKQKVVTGIALVLFWASCLFVPWELTDGPGHMDTIRYAPVFRAPTGGTWRKRHPSVNFAYTSGALLVSYAMVLVLVADTRKDRS